MNEIIISCSQFTIRVRRNKIKVNNDFTQIRLDEMKIVREKNDKVEWIN